MGIREQYKLFCWAERAFYTEDDEWLDDRISTIQHNACKQVVEHFHVHDTLCSELHDYNYHMTILNRYLSGRLARIKAGNYPNLSPGWHFDLSYITNHLNRMKEIRKGWQHPITRITSS